MAARADGGVLRLLPLALLAAVCTSRPHFPAPEPPVVGTIGEERSVIAGPGDTPVVFAYRSASAVIPRGCVAAGTPVTFRILTQVDRPLPPNLQSVLRDYLGGAVVVQILPPALVLGCPIVLSVTTSLKRDGSTIRALSMREQETSWMLHGVKTTPIGVSQEQIEVSVTEPGLWTVADEAPFSASPGAPTDGAPCGSSDGGGETVTADAKEAE